MKKILFVFMMLLFICPFTLCAQKIEKRRHNPATKTIELPLDKRYARDLGITEEELVELKKTLNTIRGAYKRHGFILHGNPKKKE